MNDPVVRTTMLWIHAVSGALWVGVAACLMMIAAAMGTAAQEWRNFVRRVVPKINRLGLGALAVLFLSGIANLYIEGVPRQFRFSPTFIDVLGAKVALFFGMAVAAVVAFRTERRLGASGSLLTQRESAYLLWSNAVIAVMGAVALILGLWLLGS